MASSVVIIKGLPEYQARLAAIGTVGDAVFMGEIAKEFAESAQRLAPVSEDGSHGNQPGNLRESIKVMAVQPSEAIIASTAPYAPAVEFGSRQHRIGPSRATRLRFFWKNAPGGARMFVGLPGQTVNKARLPAQPFFTPVMQTLQLATRLKVELVTRWNSAA